MVWGWGSASFFCIWRPSCPRTIWCFPIEWSWHPCQKSIDCNPFLLQCHVPCGILFPWPGIEHVPPAVRESSPNHWTCQGSPLRHVLIFFDNQLAIDGWTYFWTVNSDSSIFISVLTWVPSSAASSPLHFVASFGIGCMSSWFLNRIALAVWGPWASNCWLLQGSWLGFCWGIGPSL